MMPVPHHEGGASAPSLAAVAPERPPIAAPALTIAAAKTAAFVVNIALPLILVRRLAQAEFGLYRQAFLIVGTMTALLPLNFASALYFVSREPERESASSRNR